MTFRNEFHSSICNQSTRVSDWYCGKMRSLQSPIYSSYDIRDAGFKISNVDANIFPAGFNNICQTCHRVGDSAAGAKPITSADAANPYKNHSSYGVQKFYQTSHRWEGPLVEPRAGAQLPIHPLMSSVTNRTSNQLACSVCHNQHDNSNGKFLRISNANDALCMDCHRSRAVTSHEAGSHPVNIS